MNAELENQTIAGKISQQMPDEELPSESLQQAISGLSKMMGGGEQSNPKSEQVNLLQKLIELIIQLIRRLLGLNDDKVQFSQGSGKFELNAEMLEQAKQFLQDNPLLKKIGKTVLNKLHENGYLEDHQFDAINKELFSPKAEAKSLNSPKHPLQQASSVEPASSPSEQAAPAAGPRQ